MIPDGLSSIMGTAMNPLLSSPTFDFHRGSSLSNDVEMLQTDVMRFFAILCLCLMAIFALVKALPMSPPPDQPTLVKPSDLKAEAAALQREIVALKEKLEQTQAQLNSATAAVKKSQARAAGAAAVERETQTRLSRVRRELAAVSRTLKEARTEINARENTLAGIMKDISDKRRIQSELKAQIKEETRNFQKIQQALDAASAKLDRTVQAKQPLPRKKPPEPVPSKPVRKGFTLRFASDSALETLISRQKVHFFALAGKKAWKLNMTRGRPVYVAVKNPSKIYEMEKATVPADYVTGFSRQVAAFGSGKITWGVTLPGQTAVAINRLIKDREGGDLVIMPDGEVILN
jgi:septal ring factor EnvC (AmiA/AmiB activator)